MAVINKIIRKAEARDLDSIMKIIAEARGTIALLGIDQWQDGYPQREIIEEDIRTGLSYCVENADTKELVATFAVLHNGDPLYDTILDGEWRTGESLSALGKESAYTAMHRVAISVSTRGSGMSTAIIDFVSSLAAENGKRSIRIDTHKGNAVMRRMLEKHSFVHCGTIILENGDPRVAYEKLI